MGSKRSSWERGREAGESGEAVLMEDRQPGAWGPGGDRAWLLMGSDREESGFPLVTRGWQPFAPGGLEEGSGSGGVGIRAVWAGWS